MRMKYRYLAYNLQDGVIRGRLEARNAEGARAELSRMGYRALDVSTGSGLPSLQGLLPAAGKVKTAEVVRFARQLATLLRIGGNLVRALEMLKTESSSPSMRRVLGEVRSTLDEGGSLSSALGAHDKVFPPLFVRVVEVGEYTGRLGPALEQVADALEKEQEARQKAIRTMMYPVGIVVLSLLTMGVLVTVALPPLLDTFARMDAGLPFMTRLTVALVDGITGNFTVLFLGAMAAAGLLLVTRRIPQARYWLDAGLFKLPVMGPFLVAGELSRFSRALAILLDAGVPLSTAMGLGIGGCKNLRLKRAFIEAEESLIAGHGLAATLKQHRAFPSMFVEMMAIGEQSNSLPDIMADAADSYEKQLDRSLTNLLGILEPASTVVVGGIVGIIAFSMFLPIYSGLNLVS